MLTAFDVIEHLDDDMGALRTMRECLRPGGILVVTVPAFNALWGPHDVINHHRRRYTRRVLLQRLRAAGFVPERTSYFNSWFFLPVAAIRLFRRLAPTSGEPKSDFRTPHPLINRLLCSIFSFEARLMQRFSLPVGVSIICICTKPDVARRDTSDVGDVAARQTTWQAG
jgi:SAM-dependent methyltransferase